VLVTWIKICATTNLDDALASIDAGANALGFILTASSRRVTPETAAEIAAALPPTIEKVGVVVNETPQRLAQLAAQIGLTALQLHGDEPPDQLPEYRRALPVGKIFKTLQTRELLAGTSRYPLDDYLHMRGSIDGILLDSGVPGNRGGTGVPFEWNASLSIVSQIKEALPVIIAGGLDPGNVGDAIRLFDPCGVDVVSGVELAPGKKDPAKIRAFVEAVRAAAQATAQNHST
jgi:phosphoribosylanthranilate isomerase